MMVNPQFKDEVWWGVNYLTHPLASSKGWVAAGARLAVSPLLAIPGVASGFDLRSDHDFIMFENDDLFLVVSFNTDLIVMRQFLKPESREQALNAGCAAGATHKDVKRPFRGYSNVEVEGLTSKAIAEWIMEHKNYNVTKYNCQMFSREMWETFSWSGHWDAELDKNHGEFVKALGRIEKNIHQTLNNYGHPEPAMTPGPHWER